MLSQHIKITGYKRDKTKSSKTSFVFPTYMSIEKNIENLEDINLIPNEVDFKIDKITFENNVKPLLIPIKSTEDVTGQFISNDGISFHLVKKMLYGRELSLFNKDTKSFDYDASTIVEFNTNTWGRSHKYYKFNFPHSNNPTDMEIFESLKAKTVCFTGHRPKELGGYDMKNPIMMELKQHLLNIIYDLVFNHGIRRFMSGGALGADTAAFWCVEIFKRNHPDIASEIENILCTPFLEQSIKWIPEQQELYNKMTKLCNTLVNVENIPNYQDLSVPLGTYSRLKMDFRNEYMVDHSSKVIAIYSGISGGTRNCIDYAFIQKKTTYILNPKNNFKVEIREY